ncbi:MAG: phosphohydrolase [Verrucomicrobiaceae bacterium]|nr:MAG: phosphohydrolase [Verrucomicrobiaceae bacterium]
MNRSDFLRLTSAGTADMATRGILGGWLLNAGMTSASAQVTGSTLKPYLQTPRPDSMWVTWWTDNGADAAVDWGTDVASLSSTAAGNTQQLGAGYRYHSAKITGLQPSTLYYYKVRTGTATSDIYRFKTPPATGTSTGRFRVLVIGDNQIISDERRWEKLINRARIKIEEKYGQPLEEAVDFILNVGDQVDVGTLNHYRNLHFDYGKSVTPNLGSMTTVGNHETYGGDNNLSLYKNLFHYHELSYQGIVSPGGDAYYAYQLANVLFIHLNSESMPNAAEGVGSVQKQWVQDIITAAGADPAVEFIISLCHRPYQAEQYVGDISNWFRTEVMPILAQTEKHVLNIGAHHHLYARGQTRDWPIYHIISGATAWDQYWGQSTERDLDDVQKTIANWAWQLIDFDLDQRDMLVECYAEANVRLPESTRWTSRAYNSRLIDSFHRRFGIAAPDAPAITNTGSTAPGQQNRVALPFILHSSSFASGAASEVLNSTQFQVSPDAGFSSLLIDRIRDVENLYGDTGAPNYEPVNINASVNVLDFTIAANALPDSRYYARVRHRDTNTVWSAWSPAYVFDVTGSSAAGTSLSLAKNLFAPGEDILVTYERPSAVAADWIGMFRDGETPAAAQPASRQYATGGAGTRNFRHNLQPGMWFAGFFGNNTTTEIAPRVPFYVGTPVQVAIAQPAYDEGQDITINWQDAPGGASDVIAIHLVGESPGSSTPALTFPARSRRGTRTITGLAKGFYYATFLVDGLSHELSARAGFSVGSQIAEVSMASTTVVAGQDFMVNFSGGPGIPKDWIGLHAAGGTPGLAPLLVYLYFGGATAGSVTVHLPDLPPGEYFTSMFTNDSYTEVSNRFYFSVVPAP